MAATTVQLLIELRNAAVPIEGTLRLLPDGHALPFTGWLQLTETVEAVRKSQLAMPTQAGTSSTTPTG